MVTRVTGYLRMDKRYFKELSFIQVALYKCNILFELMAKNKLN